MGLTEEEKEEARRLYIAAEESDYFWYHRGSQVAEAKNYGTVKVIEATAGNDLIIVEVVNSNERLEVYRGHHIVVAGDIYTLTGANVANKFMLHECQN